MSLDSLHIDVLLCILALTDVSTILSLSQVNRAFYSVAYTKSLWLSVVRDLTARGLIDAPPDEILREFSTHALIGEIRRVVVGPHTFSKASLDPPTLARKINVPLRTDEATFDEVELLPGGKYLIIAPEVSPLASRIECWEVSSRRRVWTWPGRSGYFISSRALDFCGNRGICCLTVSAIDTDSIHMLILKIDLETWESYEIFQFPVPAFQWRIRGDFVACQTLNNGAMNVVLFNWRSGEFVQFRRRTADGTVNHALCSEHIAIVDEDRRQLHFCPFSSFASFWRPLAGFDPNGDHITTGTMKSHHIMLANKGKSHMLTIVESPLTERSYDVVIDFVEYRSQSLALSLVDWGFYFLGKLAFPPKDHVCFMQHRYRLTFSPEAPSSPSSPQMILKPASPSQARASRYTISDFAVLFYRTQPKALSSTKRSVTWPDGEVPEKLKMMPSNALLAHYPDRIMICYYL
ncbi:hypothetical protein C8R43DRAFT_1118893 [Mycena crocata]|nr:hypothetical protein C8R43DRAFT_1118893 [Mycena crocata]